MRTRLPTVFPSVLALSLVALIAVPVVTLAASPTISMYPETARPGSTVELTGTDFPPEHVVELQVATPDGTSPLATTATGLEGGFRQILALPLSATEGAWEVRATAVDGTSSTLAFTVASETVVEEPIAAVAATVAAEEAGSGNTSGDIAVMLIIAVILGAVAFGVMVVYRQIKDESPPGMGRGDDLIWGGGSPAGPEQTATEEPHWKAAQSAQAAQTAQGES
jgi:hypothetical protein